MSKAIALLQGEDVFVRKSEHTSQQASGTANTENHDPSYISVTLDCRSNFTELDKVDENGPTLKTNLWEHKDSWTTSCGS